MNIPLFPLNTVLYPGGPLPLRIFEPRYLDMISNAMKTETPIGVILIKSGTEVGDAPEIHDIGTLTEISYWHKRTDGLLGVTLTGVQRFKVLDSEIQDSQIITANVELIDNIEKVEVDGTQSHLAPILEKILEQLEPPFKTMDRKLDDVEWVSARLMELLPTDLKVKQALLENNKIEERLAKIESILRDSKH